MSSASEALLMLSASEALLMSCAARAHDTAANGERLRASARWGVLISGRGSNLGALIDARAQNLDLRIVLSSSKDAAGLLRARRAGIPAGVTPLRQELNRDGSNKIDWVALDLRLRQAGVTHVFLAGFMKIVPPSFIAKWRGQIVNLHPSLLPSYPGLHSIDRAFEDRAPMGLTIHEVNEEVDGGEIICQRKTRIAPDDTLITAEFLVHVDEQRTIQEAAVRWN